MLHISWRPPSTLALMLGIAVGGLLTGAYLRNGWLVGASAPLFLFFGIVWGLYQRRNLT
jgi:hypothetical protein